MPGIGIPFKEGYDERREGNGNKAGNIHFKTILDKFLSVVQNKENILTGVMESLSVKEQLALQLIKNSLSDGDLKSIQEIINRTDGTLIQQTINKNIEVNEFDHFDEKQTDAELRLIAGEEVLPATEPKAET